MFYQQTKLMGHPRGKGWLWPGTLAIVDGLQELWAVGWKHATGHSGSGDVQLRMGAV